jgi:hypothetical protein
VAHFPASGGGGGGGSIDEITSDDDSITITDPTGPTTDLSVTSVQSVQWVDLGLIDLVAAMMDGPTTLYDMPDGTFLASIRATDDPDSVEPDSIPSTQRRGVGVGFGTVKSFGWNGFAAVQSVSGSLQFVDISYLAAQSFGYGPFGALPTSGEAATDIVSLVLSAASVGPIEAAYFVTGFSAQYGEGVRIAAVAAWAADTVYDSPETNTSTTPGALSKCVIEENGTFWFSDGPEGGTSGGSPPDFASNSTAYNGSNTGGVVGESGTPAGVLAPSPPTLPLTVVTGTNDEFVYTGNGGDGSGETFTVAAGVYTTVAEVVAAVAAAIGSLGEAFSTYVTPSDSSGSILLTMISTGAQENGNEIGAGANDVSAALGFSGTSQFGVSPYTGAGGIVWYDTNAAPPTVGAVHAVAEIVTLVTP